ncbi:cation diffusion facilitator family transporter [Myxococcota bacterium]|nr:cation diffusion facilitator family transporter [Myxococcota bacterium]
MAHDHSHEHGHGHLVQGESESASGRAFAWAVVLNLTFVAVEVFAGVWAGSMALLADAGHNLGDVAGVALAGVAAHFARAPRTVRRTYGYQRATILAALANAVLVLVAVGGIAWESVRRLGTVGEVAGGTVMAVAAVGVAVNGLSAALFAVGRKHDLNVRAAFLHLASDAAVSLGVVGAGLAMRLTGHSWIDPATSLLISAAVLVQTWPVLRGAFDLAMDVVPEHVDPDAVSAYLRSLPGIVSVHDLHIWPLGTRRTALTAHLVAQGRLTDEQLRAITSALADRFGIGHATLQVEGEHAAESCDQANGGCP